MGTALFSDCQLNTEVAPMLSSNDSDKRERNVKTRRLPNHVHTRLSRFKGNHHYPTMWDAAIECIDQYLSILECGGYVAIEIAHNGTPEKRR
jgi:hypothetical protein